LSAHRPHTIPVSPAASRIGRRLSDQAGFSLIELLVVMIVIGVLAAIAIPSFLSQKDKAYDAQAKQLVRSAQTTAETIATEHNGGYENVNSSQLHSFEPNIRITPTSSEAYLSGATSTPSSYSLTAKAADGDELTVSKSAGGTVTRTCVSPVSKTGCGGSQESSW